MHMSGTHPRMMNSGTSREHSQIYILWLRAAPLFHPYLHSTLHPAAEMLKNFAATRWRAIMTWEISACIWRRTALKSLLVCRTKVAAAWSFRSFRMLVSWEAVMKFEWQAGLPGHASADHDHASFYCVQPRAVQRLRPLPHPPLHPRAGAHSILAAKRLCAISMTSARA